MAADHPGKTVSRLRSEFERAEREISRAAAVLDRLEKRADRAGRGVEDPDVDAAVEAFERYAVARDAPGIPGDREWRLPDEGRSARLAYLFDPLLDGKSVFEADIDPAVSDVQSFADNFRSFVEDGNVDAAELVEDSADDVDFASLAASGDGETLASLVSLFQQIVRAARRHRDEKLAALNGTDVDPGGTSTPQTNPNTDGEPTPGAGGALESFFEDVSDELTILDDQPIALLPVRLETRFVTPNDDDGEDETAANDDQDETAADGGVVAQADVESDQNLESDQDVEFEGSVEADRVERDIDLRTEEVEVTTDSLADFNRTDPSDQELRVRVYPDQIHIDSHEPELTAREEGWGRRFWAHLWYGCHPSTTDDEGNPVVDYDEDQVPADLRPLLADLDDGWQERFATDDADRHAEIKERAWGQIVERYDQERGSWIVHALAPEDGQAMLAGWAGGSAPWPGEDPPDLTFPDVDARPGSWARQSKARLLPDRWLAVGEWRRADEPDADATTVRVTGDLIQQPLPVGPNPESVAGEQIEEREGTVPEGMEWMVDWEAARDVGMGLKITPDDLGGESPGEVVFEKLLVVGVKATMDGAESTDALESLFASHHYSDGLELLRRGTPTNNHDLDSGYTKNPRPEETVDVEVGPALTEFGDFSDGDLLSRALGISDPDEPHVFAHVDGADVRSQAAARHMNSALWPGTIGYYLQNMLVSNKWTSKDSLWEDGESFPTFPFAALGDRLKWMDAWRRHFVRYVRAGGPFPPIRVGRQPYGILPVERIWSGDDQQDDLPWLETDPVLAKVPQEDDDTIETATGPVAVDQSQLAVSDDLVSTESLDPTAESETETTSGSESTVDTSETTTDTNDADTVNLDADTTGLLSETGYSVSVAQTANQVDTDLYGSSYDPVVPSTQDDTLSDGGEPAIHVRQRALRVDGQLRGELLSLLGKFTPAWEQSGDSVPTVDDEGTDSTLIDRILGREASADNYVREGLWGTDDADIHVSAGMVHEAHEGHKRRFRESLQAHDLDSLDPRLAHVLGDFLPPEPEYGRDPHSSERRHAPTSGDEPIRTVASDRAPQYLQYLYGEDFEFLREMGYRTKYYQIDVPEEIKDALRNHYGYGEGIDDLGDTSLLLDFILRLPDLDINPWSALFLFGPLVLGQEDKFDEVEQRKIELVFQTQGDGLQHTLFKQLTRFATVRAYVNSRIRLGVKWDESGMLTDPGQFLQMGPDQQPVPEPEKLDWDPKTVWTAMEDSPGPYASQYDSYAELLHETCAPGTDEPAVDPRMREHLESLQALESQSPSDLRRLLTETLDLASHRIDAWWTSLATRRLFQRREAQEVDLYDGADYAFVGSQFRRGEGTDDPSEPDSSDTEPTDTDAFVGVSGQVVSEQAVSGQTELGMIGSTHTEIAEAEDVGAPVSYVGAYGFVENLYSDDLDPHLPGIDSASGGLESEYIHGPSPAHARTAAILRSARKNYADEAEQSEDASNSNGENGDQSADNDLALNDEGLAELLHIDLSPGRVRAAKHVLDGVRQGQQLGALLGYRFERRLRERMKAHNDRVPTGDEINLVKYKFPLRVKYPAIEGQLPHDQDKSAQENGEDEDDAEAGIGTESAKSDVVDGYRLLTNWRAYDDFDAFLDTITYGIQGEGTSVDLSGNGDDGEDGNDEDEAQPTVADVIGETARSELQLVFQEMDNILDAVTDLLLSESVHQLGKGNFERAGGSIDDLVKGKPVAEPEVTQTPRDDVGLTHRLGVVFGDPETAETSGSWGDRSEAIEPEAVPSIDGTSTFRPDPTGVDPDMYLQARSDGERNLDAWIGSILPEPERVSCGASISWTADRAVDTGTFALPTDDGTVSVTELGFEPDLVVLSVPHAVASEAVEGAAGAHGWTHAIALQQPDGTVQQVSTSASVDPGGDEGGGYVSDDGFHVHVHDADAAQDDNGEISGSVAFAEGGFDLDLQTVDVPEAATDGAVVTYRAYALGNAATAELGTFEMATGTGSDSVSLSVEADHAMLFGNTVATTAGDDRDTTDAVGLSHGVVTEQNDTVSQHVVASSVEASTGTAFGGVHEDEALHLVYGSNGSVDGSTAGSVDSLGTSLDISYSSVHAADASDASRVVAYVAIETADRVTEPAVGVIDGSHSEGDRETVTTGFRPGYVEFVAAPAVSGTGSDSTVTAGGFAHGLATGVARQVSSSHAVRPDGEGGHVHAGETSTGRALSLPSVAADGTVSGHDAVRIASVGDDGFTVSFQEVAAGDQALCYRAWPAEPEEITHVAADRISLADLELAPMDALALSQTNQQAGASQLEQRMHYTLLRDPPASEPPVPDEAVVELHFDEAGPQAREDAVSIGAFLETVREIEQLVTDSRPLDATDLGHPSEVSGEGYGSDAADTLQTRANVAEARLRAAGALVENRVELLNLTEEERESGETRITEDVGILRERLTEFHREVPIDALTTVSSQVADALADDQDALVDEVDQLAEHLPGGPVRHSRVDAPLTVTSRQNQVIQGRVEVFDTDVSIDVWSTSGAEWFEKSDADRTTDEGVYSATMDFGDVTPGTGFMLYVRDGSTLLDAVPGRVLPPEDAITVEQATNQEIRGTTSADEGTTMDVTVAVEGASAPLADTSVDVEADGGFTVNVDFEDQDPWTIFYVTAMREQGAIDPDFVETGYVEPDPTGVVEDSDVLGPLLWLADRTDTFDPHGSEGPVPELHRSVTKEIDWGMVRDECELMADLHEKTKESPDQMPAESDVEAVASVIDITETSLADGEWDEGDDALELLDLAALDSAVNKIGQALTGLAVDEMFDVTGRPDRAAGLQFWPNKRKMAMDGVLTQFHGFRSHPNGVFDEDLPDVGFAPSLESVFTDVADDAYPRGERDAERFLRYLRELLGAMPRLVEDDTMQQILTDAPGLARAFHAVAFHPDEIPSGTDRSHFLADLQRLTHQPVLDAALYTPLQTLTHATAPETTPVEQILAASGNEPPFYNVDDSLLGDGDGDDGDDGESGDDSTHDAYAYGEDYTVQYQDDDGFLSDGGEEDSDDEDADINLVSYEVAPADSYEVDKKARAQSTQFLTVQHGPAGTPDGTPLTDFRYLLEQFRTDVLPRYLAAVDKGTLPPDEAASRTAYSQALANHTSTLDENVETQYGHFRAGHDAGRFDVAFRRGVLETLRRGMLRVSYFGVYGSTPQSVRGGTEADVESLLGQARGVVADAAQRVNRASGSHPQTVPAQRERLEALFGDEFPVLPPFEPVNGPELTATFGRSEELQGGDPLAAETWLQRLARVRDRPARFRRALTYAESLSGERHRDLLVGQLPHRESDLWVGLDGEDPSPGRLSLVAQFGAGFDGQFANGPIAGLFVDEHVENVPGETETTGVALNYDDPDVTAPQSVLLALPPEEEGWSREALEDVVTDTQKLMKYRMVDLQDLEGEFGTLLPMLTFPNNLGTRPRYAPSMDVDVIREIDEELAKTTRVENFREGS